MNSSTPQSLFVRLSGDGDAFVATLDAPSINQREAEIIGASVEEAMADLDGFKCAGQRSDPCIRRCVCLIDDWLEFFCIH